MMDTLKNILPKIGNFLSWLSPRKLLTMTLFFIVLIISITVFEQRNLILSAMAGEGELMSPPTTAKIKVPDSMQTALQEYVTNNKKVVSFSVVSSNIRVNQSETVYFFSDNDLLTQLESDSRKNSGSIFPIFTSSETENTQMVAAINGEFACYKYEDTFRFRAVPDASNISPFICAISLPPYYGEFSGYLLFGLKSAPSQTEIDEFRLVGTRFSTEIYTKNFRRKSIQ